MQFRRVISAVSRVLLIDFGDGDDRRLPLSFATVMGGGGRRLQLT
jgi:hypothetical protein